MSDVPLATDPPHCTRCGAELSGQIVDGHCANCMLQLALAPRPEIVEATSSLDASATDLDQLDDAVGQTIGRYKLLEKIGEGGCGVVYVAEQTEPVRRRVALKVIKLGMDTKQVVARFEAERQALAMMDHPNIAKVLDAGTTESGRPYFVMELVRGIRITDFCEQEKLDTRQRLDLFIKVCQAVQHAHQKGIIHRDIKPANILVTLHDGVPVPKVIDFGIAKATEGRLTDATVYTQLHQFIGTPAYMSPEQAEMSGLDIDTRTDIYSLGVLLYQLLTGMTPFDTKELMSSGLDAFRKAIREQEPPRPSTRLTMEWKRKNARGLKQSEIQILKSRIPEDLDWIVMRCLEKDRARRYETANGLAADIRRHLSNEPVAARPPSAAYRFQKAWRRNKLAFTAGMAVAAVLVVGLTISSWQMLVATQARDNEAQQRAKAEAAEKLAETNAQDARASLYESLLGQTRATRIARQVGYREEVFALLRKARDLDTAKKQILALRREAVASMGDFVGFHPRLIASPTGASKFALMQLAPGGRVVAISDTGGSIELRELPSGRELGRWKTDSTVRSLAFNRAGDRLVSIHIPMGRMDEETRPEGRKGEESSHVAEFTVDLAGQWRQNAWRPVPGAFAALAAGNSVFLAVAGDDLLQEIQLIDFDSKETAHRLRRSAGSWAPHIAVTSDGRKLALMQRAGREQPEAEIEIWELPAERMLRRFAPGLGPTVTCSFSEDGRYLFGLGGKGTRVFETATLNSLDQFSGYADVVHRGSILSGTPLLAVPRQQQRRFLIRDFQKQEMVAVFQEGTESLAAAFSPGGEFLLTLSRTACHLHPFRVAQECQSLNGHESAVTGIAFSPDGRRLVSVGKDRTVQLWDSASGRQIWTGDRPLPGLGQAVDFSPDGRLIGTGVWATPLVQLWDAESGRQLVQLTNSATFTWSLRFVPHPEHGLLVISGGVGSAAIQHGVGVWQINSTRGMLDRIDGASRWVHSRPPPGMMSLVMAPDAKHIAFLYKFTGPATAAAVIQDSMGRRPPVELGSVTFSVQALAFTPDGRSVAALMEDNRIVVSSTATGRPQRSFQVAGQSAKDRLIALSPTGRWLAVSTASNCGVDIYEFDTGELRYSLPDREGTTYWLAWHPKEPRLAVARDNGDIAIWDLAKIDSQLEELGLGLGADRAAAREAKSDP